MNLPRLPGTSALMLGALLACAVSMAAEPATPIAPVLEIAGQLLQRPEEARTPPAFPAKARRASVLVGGEVSFVQNEHGHALTVPASARDAIDTIVRLELDHPASGISPISPIKKNSHRVSPAVSSLLSTLGRHAVARAMAGVMFFSSAISARAATPTSERLVVYPAPEGSALNTHFVVKVRAPGGAWQSVPTYVVKVDAVVGTTHSPQDSSLAYFDFAGAVEIAITSTRGRIETARVRPLSYGITPAVSGDTLTFTLTQPRNLSVEVNGDIFGNLQLFANPIEESRPDPQDPNVIYFGPGIHDVAASARPAEPPPPPAQTSAAPRPPPRIFSDVARRTLRVPSGKTVYIAGGAIVRGRILCDRVENVRIVGRGMVEQGARGSGVRIANSRHVEVSGIYTPQCFTGGSQHVRITNVKCISYVGNGDGMNVVSSSDVVIDGVFNRNSDDCITVYGTRGGFVGGASEITVQNSTLWADVAHPILVGTHGNTLNPETLENLRFLNLDILDHMEPQLDYQGCLALNAGDSNLIRDVRFEGIRIEDFRRGQLVNVRVFFNRKYCTSPGRGVEDVLFKNITYTGSHAELSIIEGYDDTRKVRNVVFENLVINGTPIADQMPKPGWYKTADMARIFVGEHVEGVEFRAAPAPRAP